LIGEIIFDPLRSVLQHLCYGHALLRRALRPLVCTLRPCAIIRKGIYVQYANFLPLSARVT
jgi:hypothetical protein